MNHFISNLRIQYARLKNGLQQHRRWRWAWQIGLFVLVFLAISTWQTRNAVTGTAPVFSDRLLTGQSVQLQQYRGQPLLIHFWATWCPICELEQDTIQKLSEQYQVLTIAAWSGDTKAVAAYMQQEKLTFPVVIDDTGELAKLYAVQGVPSSFMVDKKGVIQFVEQGYTTGIGLRLRLWWLLHY